MKKTNKLETKDVLPNINRTQAAENAVFVPGDLDIDLQTRPSEGPNTFRINFTQIAVSLAGWSWAPSNTMWPGPRPVSIPGGILIHPTVSPQYTNIRDRQTGMTTAR